MVGTHHTCQQEFGRCGQERKKGEEGKRGESVHFSYRHLLPGCREGSVTGPTGWGKRRGGSYGKSLRKCFRREVPFRSLNRKLNELAETLPEKGAYRTGERRSGEGMGAISKRYFSFGQRGRGNGSLVGPGRIPGKTKKEIWSYMKEG